jgi:hypothetical protein
MADSADLCVIDLSDFSVAPNCPFEGNPGEVWVKPSLPGGDGLIGWDVRCKVGTDCQKSYSGPNISADFQQIIEIIEGLGVDGEITPELVSKIRKILEDAGIEMLAEIDPAKFKRIGPLIEKIKEMGKSLKEIKMPYIAAVIETFSSQPGRVRAYIDSTAFLKLPLTFQYCLVGGQERPGRIWPGVEPEKPMVRTLPATNVKKDSATLNGELVQKGKSLATTVYFQWGETTSYGMKHLVRIAYQPQKFKITLTRLSPKTTYHFQAMACNEAGCNYGADMTFTTR